MADIAMCKGETIFRSLKEIIVCPLRERCYRYKAKPNEYRQAYLTDFMYDSRTNSCPLFWEIKDNKNK